MAGTIFHKSYQFAVWNNRVVGSQIIQNRANNFYNLQIVSFLAAAYVEALTGLSAFQNGS